MKYWNRKIGNKKSMLKLGCCYHGGRHWAQTRVEVRSLSDTSNVLFFNLHDAD